jgi:hypothetical protein
VVGRLTLPTRIMEGLSVTQEKSRNSPGLFSKLVSLVNPVGAVGARVVYSLQKERHRK